MPHWSASEFSRAREIYNSLLALGLTRNAIYERIAAHLNRTKKQVENKFRWAFATPEQRAAANEIFARNKRDRRRAARPQAQEPRKRLVAHRPAWFGRCPAFRPRTEQDANRATRL